MKWREVIRFNVCGPKPVPWSAPTVVRRKNATGKTVSMAFNSDKSNPNTGKLGLSDWKALVSSHAKEKMRDACRDPVTNPVCISVTFARQAKKGEEVGSLWVCGVHWNDEKLEYVKDDVHEPDLTNLFKAVEDAMEGVVYANDVLTRNIDIKALVMGFNGVLVTVYEWVPDGQKD